jgi:DNA polymerase I
MYCATMPKGTLIVRNNGRAAIVGNCQNYPKRKNRAVRRQIVAPPGHVIVAIDYKQLELCIYAMDSKDKNLCKAVIDKEDIHRYWVDRIIDYYYPDYINTLRRMTNEETEEKIRKAGRTVIKSHFVFESFYGGGPNLCSENAGIPVDIVKSMLKELWGRYPDGKKLIDKKRDFYSKTGRTETLTGLIRYGIMPGNEVLNTVCQGTAAHLVVDAQNELLELSYEYKDPYLQVRINIHDDLSFILPDDVSAIADYLDVITPIMTKVRFPWQIVPLTVSAELGYNWSDMEEIGTFEGDYVKQDEPSLRDSGYNYNRELAKAA